MALGLVCAVGTSLCYGVGSVLQSAAAVHAEPVDGLNPRLLLTLVRTWRYPAGLALDVVGFALSLLALRSLPVYVVQSVSASFLAVTAVVGVRVLRLRMRRLDVVAIVVVVVGLVLVGLSAAPQPAAVVVTRAQWLVLAAAVALVLGCLPLARLRGRAGAWALGGAAGLAFGVVAVAARALSTAEVPGRLSEDVHVVVGSPAFYAVLVAAPFALVAYATALQRGTVVQATAPLVVGETVLPAVAGLVFLGDRPRSGWAAIAVLGFVLAVGPCLQLARFGEVDEVGSEPVGQPDGIS